MIDHLRTIVAGIATLQPDDPALVASIHLAERTGAELHLVHVYHPEDEPPATDLSLWRSSFGPSDYAMELQAALEALATLPDTLLEPERIEGVALPGRPGDMLPAYATAVGADLLVLAPTRRAGAAGAVLGTTADRVLHASSVPVLVLREPLAGHAARRVLLPTDLSEHSARALPIARELAAVLSFPDAPVLLPLFVSVPETGAEPPAYVAAHVEQAEAELAAFLGSIPAMEAMWGTVRMGSPANEILAVARQWDADLVVLGTHGRRGLPRFFLGSVAEKVLRRAPCSALVIPPAAVRAHDHPDEAEESPIPVAGVH